MALAKAPLNTIMIQVGPIRKISDIDGYNCVLMTNNRVDREKLADRLAAAKCDVKKRRYWCDPTRAGDFDRLIKLDTLSPSTLFLRAEAVEDEKIFESASAYLRGNSSKSISIYAPSEAWIPRAKEAWFNTIANALANWNGGKAPNHNPTVRSSLQSFRGVFGIPPAPKNMTKDQRSHQRAIFRRLRKVFKLFENIDTACLYYISMSEENIPGTGAIIIDDKVLALGWAVNRRNKIDYTLVLNDQHKATNNVCRWFENHVMRIAAKSPIQEKMLGVTMEQGLAAIRAHLGL